MPALRALALLCAFAVCCPAFAAPGGASIDRANRLFLAGQYAEAFALYEALGKERGSSSAEDAAYLAARCLVRMNAPEQAQARLQAFLKTSPQSPWADDALMDLAALDSTDSVDQNLRSAIARYEYLLLNYPSGNRYEEALLELGNGYVKVEAWKKAEKTFYDLLSRARSDEQEVKARLLIAALFSADTNPDQDLPRALSEYEHVILARFPKSRQLPTAYFGHAEVRRKLHDHEKAVASYRTVVERWPQHSLAPLAQSLIAYCQEQKSRVAQPREAGTVKSLDPGAEFDSAVSSRSFNVEAKDEIQILSDNTSRQGDTVTQFSGGVSVFYAGVQIQTERARYDAEQRIMTLEGPAKIEIGDSTFLTQGSLTLDPELQVIELRRDVQLQPAAELPQCSDERLHLVLRTGNLRCVP